MLSSPGSSTTVVAHVVGRQQMQACCLPLFFAFSSSSSADSLGVQGKLHFVNSKHIFRSVLMTLIITRLDCIHKDTTFCSILARSTASPSLQAAACDLISEGALLLATRKAALRSAQSLCPRIFGSQVSFYFNEVYRKVSF